MTLQVKVGGFYKRRDGSVVGPATETKSCYGGRYPFTVGGIDYTSKGKQVAGSSELNWGDLLEEVTVTPVLPFLKAGGKYDTVKPDGTPGPVVTLKGPLENYSRKWKELFPFSIALDGYIHVVSPCGLISHSLETKCNGYRITAEHIEPKPTAIERLEKWRAEYGVPSASAISLDAIIADLKAETKA